MESFEAPKRAVHRAERTRQASESSLPGAPIPLPDWRSTAGEIAGLLELPRLGWQLPGLLREPRGDGAPVFVLPGFGADDRSTWPIRRFLALLDHDVRGWSLGRNRAEVPDSIEEIGARVERTAAEAGGPVSLVGWSLGGYIAREVARDRPEAVRRVVTFGSPVIGGPKYTTVSALAARQGWDLDEIEAFVEERKRVPLRVPVTAIYSRRDGVVAWQACIDPEGNAPIDHVEVDATHLGLGFSAEVFRIVARRLSASDPEARDRGSRRSRWRRSDPFAGSDHHRTRGLDRDPHVPPCSDSGSERSSGPAGLLADAERAS